MWMDVVWYYKYFVLRQYKWLKTKCLKSLHNWDLYYFIVEVCTYTLIQNVSLLIRNVTLTNEYNELLKFLRIIRIKSGEVMNILEIHSLLNT